MSVPLPPFTSIQDATDFTTTVAPYLHQLSPAHIITLLDGSVSPSEWYFTTNPVITSLVAALSLSVFFFGLQLVTGNSSQVDRAWSLLPPAYIGHYCFYAHYALEGVDTQRLDTLVTFAILWGVWDSSSWVKKHKLI